MRRHPLIVLKFGSSVLRSEEDLPRVVHEIYRWVRRGHRVLAVVSALGSTSTELLETALGYGAKPSQAAIAALVSTGEATSVALLALALDRAGIPCALLDAARMGFGTRGLILDADPCELDEPAILRALEEFPVAVAPGFVGRAEDGSTSLLGRGGSDLTALFLAQRLGAEHCRLIKDVDGLYEYDPAVGGPRPRRF